MSVKYVNGDIFDTDCDIIVHQTNCQGVMGHGIALQVKERYPEVYIAYKQFCYRYINDKENILGLVYYANTHDNKKIANLFGQLNYGEGLQTNYGKLAKGLDNVAEFAKRHNVSVAIPYKIGCGLAHGNWEIVKGLIESIFADVDCTVYRLEKNEKYESEVK